jgi:ABC-type polysaccharide/polyol phosphate transport system ATPase subunit
MTDSQTSAAAVVVEGVSKEFRVPLERMNTLKERALHPFKKRRFEHFQALDDISFVVPQGEFFGIVGRNGSGKSTLLKCLAGIYQVNRGAIYMNGRVSTFIELGVGFNPDLAAEDNVTLNGIMLGLSPSQARERFERVIQFAELERFVDLKLKNYSSGMHVRLAFSVMIQVDADILLIDEVLAVGDAAFQQKCFDQFNRLRDEGRTLLLVTHDMGAVTRFCHRAMLLEGGKAVMTDKPGTVADNYMELNFGHQGASGVGAGGRGALGSGEASIVEAWFENHEGERVDALLHGQACSFKAVIEFHEECEEPTIGVALEDDQHRVLFATSTIWRDEKTGRFQAGDRITFTVTFENPFSSGRYYATPTIARRGTVNDFIFRKERMVSVMVTGAMNTGAQVQLPHDIAIETGTASVTEPRREEASA